MVSKKENKFMPKIAIPPGETIRENMNYLGLIPNELALDLDITARQLSNIINGKAPITTDIARKLELLLGPSVEFWMNLENNYQSHKARLEKKKKPLVARRNLE